MNFDKLYELVLEYRHNYGDGTAAQSIQAHNGKDPNIVSPDKKNLHTVGPYKNVNPKINVHGSILTAQELGDMDIEYVSGKYIENWKNTGSDLKMTTISGQPVARVLRNKIGDK